MEINNPFFKFSTSEFGILNRHNIHILPVPGRVARWYIFKPKIPIWVNFGESCNGRC
jgi:hypothetical protein